MIDPKTYEMALRAARNVARSSGRAAVGLSLLANTTGCLSSETTGAADAAGEVDAALLDAATDAIGGVVDAVMADLAMDSGATPDTVETDATTSDATVADATTPDATVVDATKSDATTPDATVADATKPDATVADATKPDVTSEDVLTEVIEGDGTSTDIAMFCECLTPTDMACTGWNDTDTECKSDADCGALDWQGNDSQCGDAGLCQLASCATDDEPFTDLVCFGGMCNEPEGFGECCEAAYADETCMGQGAIPGCSPWGPPAPDAYDGLTLADFGLA